MWVLGVEQGNLLQYNLFTYGLNNPMSGADPDGYWIKTGLFGAAVGAVVGGIIQAVDNVRNGQRLTYGLGSAMFMGAWGGLMIGSGAIFTSPLGVAVNTVLVTYCVVYVRTVYNYFAHGYEPDLLGLGLEIGTSIVTATIPALPQSMNTTLHVVLSELISGAVNWGRGVAGSFIPRPPAPSAPKPNPGPTKQAAAASRPWQGAGFGGPGCINC